MTHILFGLSTHLHHFQVIECDVYDCLNAGILVNSVVLQMFLLFLFGNRRLPIEKPPVAFARIIKSYPNF